MQINHKSRFIYFSIPKTGSESVRKLLSPIGEENIVHFPQITNNRPFYSHMRPVEVQSVFSKRGLNFEAYSSVATVRNPWARLASLYHMTCRNWGDRWQVSFEDWVENLDPTGRSTADMPEKWYAHGTMSMSQFLSNNDGCLLVNKIYRIEDQGDALYRMLAARFNGHILRDAIPHRNKADKTYNWRTMYSRRTQKIVAILYADDIERFEYNFS